MKNWLIIGEAIGQNVKVYQNPSGSFLYYKNVDLE